MHAGIESRPSGRTPASDFTTVHVTQRLRSVSPLGISPRWQGFNPVVRGSREPAQRHSGPPRAEATTRRCYNAPELGIHLKFEMFLGDTCVE